MEFTLTQDQKQAFDTVKYFLADFENPALTIAGSAGVGKTTLTKILADYIRDCSRMRIAAIAPTHKARRVLHYILNKDRFVTIPTITVASVLGKMREHTYIGSHKYSNGSKQKMDNYDCFILDEVSMVTDSDLDVIIDYICENDKKIIFIGDRCQIPPPSQKLRVERGICYKPDSDAFNIENSITLNEVVRQKSGSLSIKIATFLREHITENLDLRDILSGAGLERSEIVCEDDSEMYSDYLECVEKGLRTRIIAYTNSAVKSHNEQLRRIMGKESDLLVGELLTGYNNVGWPVPVVENGTDYKVIRLREVNRHTIDKHTGLFGYLADLEDVDDKSHVSPSLFFISVQNSRNSAFMMDLVQRAERVNTNRSTKKDYKNYCSLKNRAVFLENVYKHRGQIMSENEFKQKNPLLFTRVSDVIDTATKSMCKSELTETIDEMYGDIIRERLDDNKPFADSEVLADRYMVVEKDIYYGYALTAHKAQGSTYDVVYVDDSDFKKITNKWNYRLRCVENRCKERNQLRYVAYTRPSQKLRLFVS